MKKFIVLSLCGLLIMVFSPTVYAQKLEVKFSGFIDTQSEWWRNAPNNAAGGIYNGVSTIYQPPGAGVGYGGGYDQTVAYMDSRARLKFDAVMGKELSGTIFFEFDSSKWGELPGTGDQRNLMGYWSGDRGALEVKNLYIDFGVPVIPVPMTVRVGLQPLNIRNNLVVYTDGMGITAGIKVDPVTIAPLWFKAIEGRDASADDVDVYGLHVIAKVNTFTVGGYGLYYNMNTYPFNSVVTAYGTVAPSMQADAWWLGFYADGKLGPVDLNFDFVYDHGKVEKVSGAVARDVKYRGWATRLKIDYPWEKFNFGVVGKYASGADTRKTDPTGRPGTVGSTGLPSSKVGAYVTPPGSETAPIVGESLVFYSSWVNRGNTGIGNIWNYNELSMGGVGGSWFAKVYGSFKATPSYKVSLYALYIGDTTKNGNTVGTARKADGVTLRDDKTIGWEFDLINEFQIYKNLKFTLGAGFMIPGDGLKYWDGFGNDKPNTPWNVLTNITYSF